MFCMRFQMHIDVNCSWQCGVIKYATCAPIFPCIPSLVDCQSGWARTISHVVRHLWQQAPKSSLTLFIGAMQSFCQRAMSISESTLEHLLCYVCIKIVCLYLFLVENDQPSLTDLYSDNVPKRFKQRSLFIIIEFPFVLCILWSRQYTSIYLTL